MFAAGDQILQQQFSPTPMMAIDGRWRGHVPQAPNCPRCASTNTKFCYYNNYSLAQPRYFCKGCRRYWTKGGSLRNVPVGGGCRKSRRSRSKAHRNSVDDKGHQRHANGGDSATDSCSSSGKSTGAEIDLAAVFARYLGQEPGVPSQSASEGEGEGFQSFISENENSQTAPLDDGLFYQDVQLQNRQTEQSQYLPQGVDHHQMAMDDQGWQEGNDLGFTGNEDLKTFDHEMLLTDDVFWSTSEDGSSLSSNFPGWEPMAALEELDSSQIPYTASVLDDQLATTSRNILVSDTNWGSFDLGGYGDFYRP